MTRSDAAPPTDAEIEQLIARSQALLDELHATFREIRTLIVDVPEHPERPGT